MAKRILFTVLLFIVLFYLPFWVFLILGFVGMFLFQNYYESLVLFLFADLLYGTKQSRYFDFLYMYSFVGVLIFYLLNFIKQKMRFYD